MEVRSSDAKRDATVTCRREAAAKGRLTLSVLFAPACGAAGRVEVELSVKSARRLDLRHGGALPARQRCPLPRVPCRSLMRFPVPFRS